MFDGSFELLGFVIKVAGHKGDCVGERLTVRNLERMDDSEALLKYGQYATFFLQYPKCNVQ